MGCQLVGYVRVSSVDQNPDRQLLEIKLDKKFIDYYTGSVKERTELKKCLDYVREGDTLIVHSIDRLARNLRDLQEIVDSLIKKSVKVQFIKENLLFTANSDPMSTLMLQMMGAFAEFERVLIKSRQREGIIAAKKAGKHLGRPKLVDEKFSQAVKNMRATQQSIRSIAKELNVSRATIYKALEL